MMTIGPIIQCGWSRLFTWVTLLTDVSALFYNIVSIQPTDSSLSIQNGNITTTLPAVMVQATCTGVVPEVKGPETSGPNAGVYVITGTLSNGCNATSYAYHTDVGNWFGWAVLAPFECVQAINRSEPVGTDPGQFFPPVAFSFFKNMSMYSMVFCYNVLEEYTVTSRSNFEYGILGVNEPVSVRRLGWGPSG